MSETYHGYIETTQDVLLVFEGCRRGLLPRVCRRLQEKERSNITSGSVFVFDERESGIKRWTDGLLWSPSRILGNFLIYREVDKKTPDRKASNDPRARSFSADQVIDRNTERRLVGSLSDSYRFRKDGLIKKTMSVIIDGGTQHLVSYYHPHDILKNKLRTPSSVPGLVSLEISPDLLVKQNFRVPPMVEPSFEQPKEYLNQYEGRVHNYRSMSMGSEQHGMVGNPVMYTPTDGYRKLSNGYYSYAGYSPLPSPSSITSSPMLSPVHPSFRHHSISSSSSGPMQRFAARNSLNFMSNDMIENRSNEIGPLLNPIHPLKQEEMNFQNNYDYCEKDSVGNLVPIYRNGLVLPTFDESTL
ncbi:unnamed protein product [Rhizopus stolonifer]